MRRVQICSESVRRIMHRIVYATHGRSAPIACAFDNMHSRIVIRALKYTVRKTITTLTWPSNEHNNDVVKLRKLTRFAVWRSAELSIIICIRLTSEFILTLNLMSTTKQCLTVGRALLWEKIRWPVRFFLFYSRIRYMATSSRDASIRAQNST